MATVETPREQRLAETPRDQRFVIRSSNWAQFMGFADLIDESHVRLTYDRGRLEFMTLSHGHERCKSLLGRFIDVLTEEMNMPVQSGGSTTFGREDLDRGLEPDECYYLTNEPLVRDKDEIDLTVDPPPDLALEVDISHSSLDRMRIYAALGVPEVWRSDGQSLQVFRLAEDGNYREVERSQYFPTVPPAKIAEFLARRTEMDETSLVRAFRQWVRGLSAKS